MKHDLPYGSLDLPDDWEDRSTYQFVSPAKGPDIPLAVGRGVEISKARISVLLSRVTLPEKTEIEEFLRRQTTELRNALPTLRVLNRDAWKHPCHGAIPAIDMTFEISPGLQVRQLQFFFPASKPTLCACLTISCSNSQYESEKDQIKRLFENFSPASGLNP